MGQVRDKQDAELINSYPVTRNSQRVAFTIEPLTWKINAESFGL